VFFWENRKEKIVYTAQFRLVLRSRGYDGSFTASVVFIGSRFAAKQGYVHNQAHEHY